MRKTPVTRRDPALSTRLPVLVLGEAVVFPGDVASIHLRRPEEVRLLDSHPEEDALVGCFYPLEERGLEEDAERSPVHPVGVAARVVHRIRMPGDALQAVLQGLYRVRRLSVTRDEPPLEYEVEPIRESEEAGPEEEARVKRCLELASDLVLSDPSHPAGVIPMLRLNTGGPGRFADLVGTHLGFGLPDRRRLAATADPAERLQLAEEVLQRELGRRRLIVDVSKEARARVEREEREVLLRAEMDVIRRQLGEEEDTGKELDDLRARVAAASLPEAARQAADTEIARLVRMSPVSAEYHAVRAYVGWLVDLPWSALRGGAVDLRRAREVLDEDQYGLEEAKERILEVLAVLDVAAMPPVLCLAGPPGTGKTSLGRSLARASGRAFVRMSFAGMDDEAEIEGTRRNYVGAMPGRILQGLRRAGVRDPVFMIDDIDKMGRGAGADPASALVEAFDPETRDAFLDVYLDVPFDLSQVFFVVTANLIFDVPLPLRDRVEVITLPGYTPQEKFEIARRHLVPKAQRRTATRSPIQFTDEALHTIVADYTREAGVRHLERLLHRTYRRLALRRATGQTLPERITVETVREVLGPPSYSRDLLSREPSVGIATGLAWTADGGVVQLIEVLSMPGSGRIVVTGRLGDVMRESADIAYSWVRAHASSLGIGSHVRDVDLHVHAPEGGVKKDGPSSGVALATAMVSVLTHRPVRPEIAMSGELTLRGEVIAVGGIREKVSAAQRAGIHRVLLPAANRKDVDALSADLRTGIRFDFYERVGAYLEAALMLPADAPE